MKEKSLQDKFRTRVGQLRNSGLSSIAAIDRALEDYVEAIEKAFSVASDAESRETCILKLEKDNIELSALLSEALKSRTRLFGQWGQNAKWITRAKEILGE